MLWILIYASCRLAGSAAKIQNAAMTLGIDGYLDDGSVSITDLEVPWAVRPILASAGYGTRCGPSETRLVLRASQNQNQSCSRGSCMAWTWLRLRRSCCARLKRDDSGGEQLGARVSCGILSSGLR